MKKKVVIRDRMQRGYVYWRTEPVGRNFARGFTPHVTPKEMLRLGIFGGKYMTDCREEFPRSWFGRARLCAERHDARLNCFRVNASQSLAVWRRNGWIHRQDLPLRLEDIILKMLEKYPQDRSQSASELRADLRRLIRELESPGAVTVQPAGRSSGAITTSAMNPEVTASDTQVALAILKRHRVALASIAIGLAITIAGVGFLLRKFALLTPEAARGTSLQDWQFTPVTATGNAWRPAFSPDGRFVVYIRRDGKGGSLRVRQLSTQSDVELVPEQSGLNLVAASVTPDGSFVDFVRGKDFPSLALWRVPFLGGSHRLFMDSIGSAIGWSPDGKQIAFVRASYDGWSRLFVAEADGTHERMLTERSLPSQFISLGSSSGRASVHPAWSPDGKTIALIGLEPVGTAVPLQAVLVDAGTGSERSIALPDNGRGDGIEWIGDDELVVSVLGRTSPAVQLWKLSTSDAAWSRVTNDLSNYANLSVTANRDAIVTAQTENRVEISVLDASSNVVSEVVRPTKLANEALAWAGDRLLYVMRTGDGRRSIWAARLREAPPEELIVDAATPGTTHFDVSIDWRFACPPRQLAPSTK